MRKIREIMRLKYVCGLANDKIADSCGVSETTVRKYLKEATASNITWEKAELLTEEELSALIFPPKKESAEFPINFEEAHLELKKKGVTKELLWREYREHAERGYSYSQYCRLYQDWLKTKSLVMRQNHQAGEKAFVDFAGKTVPIWDESGRVMFEADIFVGVLGASQYCYAEAVASQGLEDWIKAHIHMLEFFGGVPEIVVPDNLKSAVSKACRYEPDLNPTYHEFAVYYQFAVIPARAKKPKDKAKVENAVGLVTRWILAVLRKRKFFSLSQLNEAIFELLEKLNHRKFQKIDESRYSLFEKLDKPALKPLPLEKYEFSEIFFAKVNIDYHIAVKENYYSIPYQYVGETVTVKLRFSVVEVLHKNKRLCIHQRSYGKHQHITTKDHMPKSHQRYLEWTPSRIINWAKTVGPFTASAIEHILISREHPQQAYRSCLGVLRLQNYYGPQRLELACGRANHFNICSYKKIKTILEKNLDKLPLEESPKHNPIVHENIRGGNYYQITLEGETSHESESNDREIINASSSWDDQGLGRTDKDDDECKS